MSRRQEKNTQKKKGPFSCPLLLYKLKETKIKKSLSGIAFKHRLSLDVPNKLSDLSYFF